MSSPSKADMEQWAPVMAHVAAARSAIDAADSACVDVLLALDGTNRAALDVATVMSRKLAELRMVLGHLRNPVDEHWGGGDRELGLVSYSWRYRAEMDSVRRESDAS